MNTAEPPQQQQLNGPVWNFLTATREPAAFRTVRDKHPNFDLCDVPEADDAARSIWVLRCEHDAGAVQHGRPLDDVVADALRAIAGLDPSAPTALDWLCDPKATIYKKPSAALKVALQLVDEWQSAPKDEPFEWSTDTDLDGLLGTVKWLWPDYIPRGFVTGLVAEQDAGKSTVAQDFCRTLISGGRWPDGQTCARYEGQLLWIDTDGNLPLFHQKLDSWQMPRGRFVFPPDALQELSIDDPKGLKWIEQAIEKFRFPLVVIDALSGSHNGKENDTDSMKVIMKRLHTLAQKYKIAIIVIHHLNKAPAGVPVYPLTIDRLRGSTSISQFCRSILALTTPDPTQPNARRLDVIKLNLAKKPPAVGYVLTDDGPAWGNAPEPPKERHTADDAADFLRDALKDGKRPAGEIYEEATAKGVSDYALRAARKSLGVTVEKSRAIKNAPWTWELPKREENE